ncbi:MAG: KpsF/GutQ family sugar-phosphate isomerase [Candidatus Melainabacteria bacterium]|nr:KpsF/GutQ family sugar-phosphate isomerase [Candidatus Melainabacteria bacterium]
MSQARQVLELESAAILGVRDRLGHEFEVAIGLLLKCTGKVVVTGMGKSGHIASKIASTFASTGTPAFFVHPAELRHGDFGMLEAKDVVVAISGSGETQEMKLALDPIKRLGCPIIALTGNKLSTLGRFSDVVLDVAVLREACPLNLAPTSSTTAALAMGDALAVALMTRKNFKAEDFARSHPGGTLGRQLLTVGDVMRSGVEVPKVGIEADYAGVLAEIECKRLGFTSVVDGEGLLGGIITDGDLRRALVRWGPGVFVRVASEIMSANPKTISSRCLAVEALRLMETHSISDLLIVDGEHRPIGVIALKDLLRAGVI